jgi:hypothetical protein
MAGKSKQCDFHCWKYAFVKFGLDYTWDFRTRKNELWLDRIVNESMQIPTMRTQHKKSQR